jgi:CBS domain containing-hemolysin-like protein
MVKRQFSIALITLVILVIFIPIVYAATGAPSTEAGGDYTAANVIALVLYMLLALMFSFLCSVAEAVFLNITPSFIADLQEKNPTFAEKVKTMRQEKVDQSLAAILTMNTIAHTVGSIGSGAEATIVFGSVWFGVFSAVMTLLILFLSEIIPKTVGVVFWRKLVGAVIRYIEILSFFLYPFIWISETITHAIAKDKDVHLFSRDEFVAMAGVGEEAGEINYQESTIIRNLFRLGSIKVKDIYTPRTVILGFDENMTVNQVLERQSKIQFSRLIIYEHDLDNITGFVLTDEVLLLKAQDKGGVVLKELKHEIVAVPINITLSKLLDLFLQERKQIALVVDEFGTKGLVTVEDVLETLLGIEIMDETDRTEDMRKLAKQLWKKRMEALGMANGIEDAGDEVELHFEIEDDEPAKPDDTES